jgi:hypothetical protein
MGNGSIEVPFPGGGGKGLGRPEKSGDDESGILKLFGIGDILFILGRHQFKWLQEQTL